MPDISKEEFLEFLSNAARKYAQDCIQHGLTPTEGEHLFPDGFPASLKPAVVREATKLLGLEDNPDLKGF